MNPLLKRFSALRFKVRFLDAWLGICALVSLVLGVGVGVGMLDFFVHIPNLIRAVLLVGLLVGSGLIVFRYMVQPFSRPCDDLSLALRVEEAYPELNDALATTVQFLQQGKDDQARTGGSEVLRERTVQDTMEKASKCDFGRILDRRAAAFFGAGATCILAAAAVVVYLSGSYATIAFWRFVEPFGHHPWTQITVAKQAPLEMLDQPDEDSKWKKIDPKEKDRIAIGRPYFIKVTLQGQIPKKARVEIKSQGQVRSDKDLELKPSADNRSASFVTAIDMTAQYQKFMYRILANDGSFPPRRGHWHVVDVRPPPKLMDLDGLPSPQITVYPPAYSDLPTPRKLDPGARHLIDLLAGTNVVLRAKADRPLEQAWIEYRPEIQALPTASVLSFLGQTDPLQAVAQVAAGSNVWGRIPAQFEGDGSTFQISFMPMISGAYVLHLRDADRLDHQMFADLRVQLDPVPEVKLISPRSSLTLLPGADVPFKALVTDKEYAIKSVFVEYRRKGLDGVTDDPVRNVLYESSEYGKFIPYWMARMSKSPLRGPDLRLRHQKLEVDTVWSLRNQFRVGDLVVVEVCADDFCDIYPTREPGRSHAVELRIISKPQMSTEVERTLSKIQQELKKITQLEQKALSAAQDTKKQEKIDQKTKDHFNDNVEQPQREVKDRIGNTSEEGIRRDIKDLRQMLKNNKLTDEQAYKDASMIQGTLESIAQRELSELEPKLAEVRNDLAQNEKNTPATKKKLEGIAQQQDKVVKALSELNQKLEPNAKMNDLRAEARDLSQKQADIQQRAENLNAEKQEIDKNPDNTPKDKATFAENQKPKIEQLRTEQLDLADKMDKLLKDMKDAKANYEKLGDKKNAQKLDEAIKKAEEPKLQPKQKPMPDEAKQPPISAQMKDVAKQLQNKDEASQKALKQQQDIANNLDEVVKSLEGRSEDVTKQEMKERKDAEKKIDDIAKKLDNLRKETKKVEMIQDKEEKLKKKQELAQKHAELQEEIEKTRRELARLNEQRAADALNEANEKLGKAEDALKQGGNPEQEQKKAKQDLEQAKEELKQAQEELARELLVKMADQLEGLKIRQVASLERSESLHGKIMKLKSWTDAFLDTMDGNLDAQKGIADETDTFKEKLKEAIVFHDILKKAKESMDKAADTLNIRREAGKERRYENGEKMDAMELKDEADWHTDTLKHQKHAVKRLDHLLDAIKEELARPKKQQAKKEPMEDDPMPKKEPEGGIPPQDGIPSMAQLKALRAEQLDLNERTADFAKRAPDLNKLTEPQQNELRELSREQQELNEIFQRLVATPPEQKEGDPK